MKILIFGISGMLGHAMFHTLSKNPYLEIIGTLRSNEKLKYFTRHANIKIITGIDMGDLTLVRATINEHRPNVVINCIGLVKQLAQANDPLQAIPINSLLPHHLSKICYEQNSRFVHISTDCVFSGKKGMYLEDDFPDADDLYGRSKLLGEVTNQQHTITLRTSIIGHEIEGQRSLVDWFLSQEQSTNGYSNAIFSGLPTPELASIVQKFVLPNSSLHGLFHVAAEKINKFDLLKKISTIYNKEINIISCDNPCINRSLNANKFNQATGYTPPTWDRLIKDMHSYFTEYFKR